MILCRNLIGLARMIDFFVITKTIACTLKNCPSLFFFFVVEGATRRTNESEKDYKIKLYS